MATTKTLLTLSFALLGLGVFAGGCGGDEATEESAAGLCGAAASWSDQCAATKVACDDAILATCDGVTDLLNPSVMEEAGKCLEEKACGASPVSCLASSVAKATQRPSHVKLAEAFCGCLLTGKEACIAGIAGGEGPAKAALTIALPLGDSLADALTETCAKGPACSTTFSACAQGVIAKKLADTLSVEAATCIGKSVLDAGAKVGNEEEEEKEAEPVCQAKSCADLGETCGDHDDGCGGAIACGKCNPACTPKSCSQLGKSCGLHPDGCGSNVDCGPCATTCTADTSEPNATFKVAKDIGATTDFPQSKKTVANLTLPDADEDWFKTKVTDAGIDGNPTLKVSVGRPVEVSVFYVCDAGGDGSTCPNSVDKADTTVGKGCRGKSSVSLSASCSGLKDSGTAYVRVRKLASDGQCVAYTLTVDVD